MQSSPVCAKALPDKNPACIERKKLKRPRYELLTTHQHIKKLRIRVYCSHTKQIKNRINHLVSVLVQVPLAREGVPLLVVEVLLQVEEGVEEDGRHPAVAEVGQGDAVPLGGGDHVQHLSGRETHFLLFILSEKRTLKFRREVEKGA